MKITRKHNSLIAFLVLATTFNGYSMEPEDTENTGWVTFAGKAITGGVTNLKLFLSYIHSGLTEQFDPFPFTELPQDIQNSIISLLINNTSAPSLEEAAKTINALAQTNHQLNSLINDPEFCLQIIWHLAEQFDCSDQTAATALQTKESKQRLSIQMLFATLFTAEKKFNKNKFKRLYKKHKDYIDLNFSYGTEQEDSKMTLLMIATYANDSTTAIRSLLDTNLVDINSANKYGMTALMLCILKSDNPRAVALLCKCPTININQQDFHGNTALMLLCKNCSKNYEYMKILLNNGADPEIADKDGSTPLKELALCDTSTEDSQKMIDLLEHAIEKKHHKK